MQNSRITLGHGSGGKLSHDLIESVFIPQFANDISSRNDDSAVFSLANGNEQLAFTTDSYVVKPLIWAGGDIGKLAVCGTVNDLAVVGATPLYLSAAFVIEEGLLLSTLKLVVKSMAKTAVEANVKIVTGDTKVVERGNADGLFINTAGVGVIPPGFRISGDGAKVGDAIILSGSIGDHGIAVLSAREGLVFANELKSDVAPLNHMISAMLNSGSSIHVMRDPTRGGLATTLKEIAKQSKVAISISEEKIPVKQEVTAACEMLGYDPLHVANEGKLIACVARNDADRVLDVMRSSRYGQDATIIGEVMAEPSAMVMMKTKIGGTRIVDMLVGEMLPRIC